MAGMFASIQKILRDAVTLKSVQTLESKTLASPTISGTATATGATISGGTLSAPTLTGTIPASGATLTSPTMTTPTLGVASATSINFGQSALNYYGEGTWTPSVGGSATYTTQTGRYTRIGRLVMLYGVMTINAIGTGSTTTVTGAPFTAQGANYHGSHLSADGTLAVSPVSVCAAIAGTSITFNGRTAGAASATLGLALFGNGASVQFNIMHDV